MTDRGRQVRPIGPMGPLHKVHHHHVGPWVRNWTGLRTAPHEEKWTVPERVAPATLLQVPLTISHVGSSERTVSQTTQLLVQVNQMLMAAGIAVAVAETADWNLDLELEKLPSGEWKCPFAADIDHTVPCLHLGLVQHLGDLDALTFACGRCLMLPDRAGPRPLAQALATMLGLMLANGTDQLMSPAGSGMRLTGSECETLRYHAGLLLGHHPTSARKFVLPLWAYQVCTPSCYATNRSSDQLHALLNGVNEIWQQADLELQMHAWCHLQEAEVDAESWAAVLDLGVAPQGQRLAPSTSHDPHAVHAFFLNAAVAKFGVACDRKRNLLVMRDQVGKRSVRALARVLGGLLGLPAEPLPDQLMCPQGEGTMLNGHEIELARRRALAIVYGQEPGND
jgi:hypothetical protein